MGRDKARSYGKKAMPERSSKREDKTVWEPFRLTADQPQKSSGDISNLLNIAAITWGYISVDDP
jgi:hypothetical protein